jgi:hypothetical protein
MKTGIDRNGNKVLRVSIPGRRGFSIQTNGNLPRTHRDGVGHWSESEASEWVKQYGTQYQQAAMTGKASR